MTKHIKPTKEELEENINKAKEELDKPETPPAPEPTPAPPEPTAPEPTPSVPVPTPSDPAPEPTPAPPEPTPSPDYKKKFKESSTEAQILYARNKSVNEAIIKANQLPEPTEEELQTNYPDWDIMTDFEKKTAKSNFINERRWKMVDESTKPFVDMEHWAEEVSNFINDPKTTKQYPDLTGKEEQFQEYATRVTKSGVPFEVLIPAFLHTVVGPKIEHKGKMFEEGNGGSKVKIVPKTDKISVGEAAELAKTDYNAFKEKLKTGKITPLAE